MRMLTVSEPTVPAHRGGSGKSAFLLASELAVRGHDVTMLCQCKGEPVDEEIAGVRVVRVPREILPAGGDISDAGRVLAHLDALGAGPFDVVHDVGGFVSHLYPVTYAYKARGARVLLHLQLLLPAYLQAHHHAGHPPGERYEPFRPATLEWHAQREISQCLAVRLADRVLSPSRREAEAVRRTYAPRPGRLHVVPSPVPKELFSLFDPASPPAVEAALAFAGRVDDPIKGADLVAATMQLVLERRPGTRLRLIARGIPKPLRAMRDSIDHVDWLRGDLEVGRALQGATALLMPSRYESFGMMAAEAMAVGVPVLASRAGALAELIDDGVDGHVVDDDDERRWPAAIADRAVALLEDPGRAARLGARAAAAVRRVSADAVAAEVEAICEEVLAEPPGEPGSLVPPALSAVHEGLIARFLATHAGVTAESRRPPPAFASVAAEGPARCSACTRLGLSEEALRLVELGRQRLAGDGAAPWTGEEREAFAATCPIGIVQRAAYDEAGAG